MADLPMLFDEWAASFARGERPDPQQYLARAGVEADALLALMDAYLQAVPRREPSAEAVDVARNWISGSSPLAELRARRGLTRDQVVDTIVAEFKLAPGQRSAVRAYYHRLEAGLIDAAGLSTRLARLLEQTLAVSRERLIAWRPRRLAATAAYRADDVESAVVSPTVDEPFDREVDALFTAGS